MKETAALRLSPSDLTETSHLKLPHQGSADSSTRTCVFGPLSLISLGESLTFTVQHGSC